MKNNMSNTDRIVRLILIAIIVALYVFNIINGMLAIALLTIAGILLITTFVNFCPIYRLIGFSTCKV